MAIERQKYQYTPYDPTKSTEVTAVGGKKTDAESDYDTYVNTGYIKSQDVINAETNKLNAENVVKKYGNFSYGNQGMFDDVMNRILNREKFSYDLNGDALYQQYKDMYVNQGKMASADVMGQAAAMTGGYGNSYSASVGNQAYQASLQQLNNVIPQLYQMALDKYNSEGQDLYNQYGMLSDDRQTQYGIWSDGYDRAVADRGYYSTEADNAFNRDYGMWADKGTMLNNNRTYWGNEYNNAYTRDFNEHTTTEGYKYQDIADANAFAQWKAGNDIALAQLDLSERQVALQENEANKTTPVTFEDYDTLMATAAEYATDKYTLNAYLNAMEDQGLPAAIADAIYAQYFPEEKKDKEPPKYNVGGPGGKHFEVQLN